MAEIPRIKSQKTAAAMIQITTGRLRQMEIDPAAWWTPDLRTEEGYDVCGIVRSQLQWNSAGSGDEDLAKRKAVAEVERIEFQRNSEELKAWELERQKALNQENILPSDVFAEFTRELLGMIRTSLVDMPADLADHVSRKDRKLFYVPESRQKSERDASPLQKSIRKLLKDIEDWLQQDPREETE